MTDIPVSRPSTAGDGIAAAAGAWRFDGIPAEVFERHITRSIPRYGEGHDLVVALTAPRVARGGRVYELGCSTGALTAKLAACAGPAVTVVGVDQVAELLRHARQRCADWPQLSFEQADICDVAFAPARVIVSYYTLHFIPLAARAPLVARIRAALEPGGLFVLFEKVRDPDAARDRKLVAAYHAFKAAQGFSADEIRTKAAALEGILVPQTEQENTAMLRQAGFTHVAKVFEELCWQGYTAEP
jgi:tRNA (cmo5U34)-methyltransferase